MGFFGFLKGSKVEPPQDPATSPSPDLFAQDIPPPPQSVPEMDFIHEGVHADDLDSIPLPPMSDPASAFNAPLPDPAPAPPPVMPELPPVAPQAAPLPTTPEAQPAPAKEAPLDLPDFTDEQIAKAEKLTPKVEAPKLEKAQELPALEPLPALEEPAAPFISVQQYQEALELIRTFKSSVRKGDLALAKLGSSTMAHKQPFARFAEEVNSLQEKFIAIDNIMISQR